MRLAALSALLLVLVLAGSADAIAPGPATIEVTIRQTGRVNEASRVVRTYAVLNRPRYRHPIGVAVLVCVRARPNLWTCRALFQFTRGQISTDGLVTRFDLFRLAVTGGTGYYDNVGGSLIAQQIGSDAWAVRVSLAAF